jgi:hypothetical protein
MTIQESLEKRLHRTAREDNRLPESPRGIHAVGAAIRGLQAGFVATLIMTAFRLPIMRSLPPSANFWAMYVGRGDVDDYPGIGLVLHLLYGIGGGAIFGGLFALLSAERAIEPEQRGIVWGSVFGLVMSVFGTQVVLDGLLDSQLDADELALFHAGHLVYGISLGAWVGSRTEGVTDLKTEYNYESE